MFPGDLCKNYWVCFGVIVAEGNYQGIYSTRCKPRQTRAGMTEMETGGISFSAGM